VYQALFEGTPRVFDGYTTEELTGTPVLDVYPDEEKGFCRTC